MNKKLLYAFWVGLFILCACCGFIPQPEGPLVLLMTICSLLFFLPPGLLLWDSGRRQDVHTLKLIRNLSALSLGLTLVLLVLNFLTVLRSEFLGSVLHYILVIVSSPMICSGHWAMSLFLWACLFTASVRQLKR
jgi:hypothetical protein